MYFFQTPPGGSGGSPGGLWGLWRPVGLEKLVDSLTWRISPSPKIDLRPAFLEPQLCETRPPQAPAGLKSLRARKRAMGKDALSSNRHPRSPKLDPQTPRPDPQEGLTKHCKFFFKKKVWVRQAAPTYSPSPVAASRPRVTARCDETVY